MVIEYTDFDDFIYEVDHNCIGYNKYFPKSERWYVIKKSAAYFKIDSFDEIERKILKLDLPKNYKDLESKTSSIIKLWLLLVRYAELLIKNDYIEYCDLYDEMRFFKRYKYIHFDLTDLNYIQRMLLDLHKNLSDDLPAGHVFYNGYTNELDDSFTNLVRADIKLFKYNREYIDSHRSVR